MKAIKDCEGGKKKFLRIIIERCPASGNLLDNNFDRCWCCEYRGTIYEVTRHDRPYKFTVHCNYKKG